MSSSNHRDGKEFNPPAGWREHHRRLNEEHAETLRSLRDKDRDMSAKHTPAPWVIKPNAPDHPMPFQIVGGPDERQIGHVCNVFIQDRENHHAANARLIAAALEMLKALEICFESFYNPDDLTLRLRAIAQASAAIIIANGGAE